MKKEHGFTLIELMVGLIIAAVLLAIGVPSFTNLIVSNRLTTQTNEIIATINFARSEAVKRNRTVNFCRTDGAAGTACAGAGTWEHWIVLAGAGNVVRRGSLNRFDNTIGVTSSLPGGNLVLSPDGLSRTTGGAMANGQTITVCATNGPAENARRIDLAAGSRLSTTVLGEACAW